jgi:hypothetical protein
VGKTVQSRLHDDEHAELTRRAAAAGLNLSEFIRRQLFPRPEPRAPTLPELCLRCRRMGTAICPECIQRVRIAKYGDAAPLLCRACKRRGLLGLQFPDTCQDCQNMGDIGGPASAPAEHLAPSDSNGRPHISHFPEGPAL